MATTFTFSAGSLTNSYDISDTDTTRVLDHYKVVYATEANPNPTSAEMWAALSSAFMQGLIDNVVRGEKQTAAKTAIDGVADIPITAL